MVRDRDQMWELCLCSSGAGESIHSPWRITEVVRVGVSLLIMQVVFIDLL